MRHNKIAGVVVVWLATGLSVDFAIAEEVWLGTAPICRAKAKDCEQLGTKKINGRTAWWQFTRHSFGGLGIGDGKECSSFLSGQNGFKVRCSSHHCGWGRTKGPKGCNIPSQG